MFIDADDEYITDEAGNKVRNPEYRPIKDQRMRDFFSGYSVAIKHMMDYFNDVDNDDLSILNTDIDTDFIKAFDDKKVDNDDALKENDCTRTALALKQYLLINMSYALKEMLTKASEEEDSPHSDRMA